MKVFLIGDSTMQDNCYDTYPQKGWGQILKYQFTKKVEVLNHAKNGRSTKSFIDENRFLNVLENLSEGDYVICQFGHNDYKDDILRYSSLENYRNNLDYFYKSIKDKKANIIFVTSIPRLKYEDNKLINTHKGYVEEMISYSKSINNLCINMHEKLTDYFNDLGYEKSKEYFMILDKDIYPNFKDGLNDETHLRYKGAKLVSDLFIKELKKSQSKLKDYLVNEELYYTNPIINQDYSDPDVIRVDDDFFLISSSFNFTKVVPILHSKNLVDFRLINYINDKLPTDDFNKVVHGGGAWAPSIRFHKGYFYAIVPFVDHGIYVSKTTNPFSKWSEFTCLISQKGVIDPCVLFDDDGKCYLVCAFSKSRLGFNSVLAIYEVNEDLTTVISDYKIIFDGHDNCPTIEGPKIHKMNGFYYILAPCGGVKHGWQVCLRSKNIYGPYESKIVLMRGDSNINGPHQGALVDINENDYYFIHFQDKENLGRVCHLQPVRFINNWPIIGRINDELLAGSPISTYKYPVNIYSDYSLDLNDDFKNTYNMSWQMPSNINKHIKISDEGLILKCFSDLNNVNIIDLPYMISQKISSFYFSCSVEIDLKNASNYDEGGLIMLGTNYGYISIIQIDEEYFIKVLKGSMNNKEELLENIKVTSLKNTLSIRFEKDFITVGCNNDYFNHKIQISPLVWVGSKIGLFSINRSNNNNGSILFKNYKVDLNS